MSRAMKPRKLDALDACAPWPTRLMIGPWWAGSLFGFDESNARPGEGAVRNEALLAVPRHAVFAVETRSWKSFVSPSQGAVAPVVGPGALMKCRTAIGSASPLVATRARPTICREVSPTARPNV